MLYPADRARIHLGFVFSVLHCEPSWKDKVSFFWTDCLISVTDHFHSGLPEVQSFREVNQWSRAQNCELKNRLKRSLKQSTSCKQQTIPDFIEQINVHKTGVGLPVFSLQSSWGNDRTEIYCISNLFVFFFITLSKCKCIPETLPPNQHVKQCWETWHKGYKHRNKPTNNGSRIFSHYYVKQGRSPI